MTSNGAHLAMSSPSPPVSPDIVSVLPTSPQTIVIKGRRYRQRKLGPAPFASFEDLSDELDSPPETARVVLPGIKEDPSSYPCTPLPQVTNVNLTDKEEQGLKDALTSSLDAPAPPRIDISRASSSSQHEDSITSSPERENGTHNLGYKEDGTVDLRSSTEELDYTKETGTVEESEEKKKRERKMKRQQQVRDYGDTQSQCEFIERKDSSCSVMSDVGLLCISGRTSRLSSIGSAASGGSVASGASHLSVGSHLSDRSTRSPSPHKMLLETSFCGSRPVSPSGNEAPPLERTTTEKPTSRPPSRLRSRSPSPHKMLLETSFCGTKQIPVPEKGENQGVSTKVKKKSKSKSSKLVVTEAEIVAQKSEVQLEMPPKSPISEADKAKKIEKVKQPLKPDQIKKMENTVEAFAGAAKIKPLNQVRLEKKSTKPKKVISLRDLPVDEIYIPLKGPELDLEEIIRKASPNVKKKTDKIVTTTTITTADEIYIPLHSPPKSSAENEKEMKQNFEETYVSLQSPPIISAETSQKNLLAKQNEIKKMEINIETKQQKKMKAYEVCEDGSIFIPLHSPEEEKSTRKFEDEIKRVDKELQKAREAAEKRSKEEEKQTKPASLDLCDSSNATRLSQTLPALKQDVTSGGSRTPSPGSSLSRKSSFASLFRKSEMFGTPESQNIFTSRKKSGTFSNALRDAKDGLGERRGSRGKNREYQNVSPVPPSPSGKKNMFTNLFAKKKTEIKSTAGKKNELPSQFDLQFSFKSGPENEKQSEEGCYIIIPLRDPSDPAISLEDEEIKELPLTQKIDSGPETPQSPLVILEKSESPKVIRSSKEFSIKSDAEKSPKSISKESLKKELFVEGEEIKIKSEKKLSSEIKESKDWFDEASSREQIIPPPKIFDNVSTAPLSIANGKTENTSDDRVHGLESVKPDGDEEKFLAASFQKPESQDIKLLKEKRKKGESKLEHDSSTDLEEKEVKEEVVAILDSGVRKLQLPPEPGDLEDDHERKGLVYQESFEDELPYVPTTLPLERSLGVQIIPVKNRVAEIKTCPIERPRSTTPINPTTLEDFVISKEIVFKSHEEKMKIQLPREDSIKFKAKSPRRFSGKGKTWFEFAEAGLQSPRDGRKSSIRTTPSPPPLPPRSSPPSTLSSSAPPTTTSWINFEELPEKRKLPKRITTVPTLRNSGDGGSLSEKAGTSVAGSVVYSYVSPEDCQCECHDHNVSQAKESDSKRGIKDKITTELEVNCEGMEERRVNKRKFSTTHGNDDTSECLYCEKGRHIDRERSIEETPLLDTNSDVENEDDSLSRKDEYFESPSARIKAEMENKTNETDFYKITSSESVCLLDDDGQEFYDSKSFEMDVDVDSNHSSLQLSQDDRESPNEFSNKLF